jgi:hypothetical protein
MEDSTTQQPSTEAPSLENIPLQSDTGDSTTQQPSTEAPPTPEPSTEAPSLANTPSQSDTGDSTTQQPSTEAPSLENTPLQSDTGDSTTQRPSTEAPSVENTPSQSDTEDSTTQQPSTEVLSRLANTPSQSDTSPPDSNYDPNSLNIENIIMVDVGNNIDISTVQECLDCLTNETLMSIRAEPFGDVGSVYLEIAGEIADTQTENEAPYTLFGDTDGVVTGMKLPVGMYRVKAQAFREIDLKGESGVEKSAYFYVK